MSLFSRLSALAFGRKAEALAAAELKKKGYRILDTNFRIKGGEVDIIARDGDVLVFCEVKARRGASFGRALEGVTPQKVARVRLAAEQYILRHNLQGTDVRFDVAAIDADDERAGVEVIKNAF